LKDRQLNLFHNLNHPVEDDGTTVDDLLDNLFNRKRSINVRD